MDRGPGVVVLATFVSRVVAVGLALVLGSLGYVFVGFGVMTDCTTYYESCGPNGCEPCAATSHWLLAGALLQGGIVVIAAWSLWPRRRGLQRPSLGAFLLGPALVVASLAAMVVTSWQADHSYCQPGSPYDAESYCSAGR